MKGRWLIACEESGEVRRAMRALGYDAWSCDLLPASDGEQTFHLQGDVRGAISGSWDGLIAHPPCTRLCNSGVRWLQERNLWAEMEEAAQFFKWLLDYPIPLKVIENPIPHKYALEIIGRKYDQIIQPWMFGHGETKATCLWLEGLPKLIPTAIVAGREHRIHRMPPGKGRSCARAKTYPGIAAAMAEQWGGICSLSEGGEDKA